MQRIIFFNSHPIQYFVPLYQELAKEPGIALEVMYCSDETLKGATDKQFGVKVQWDIPLLEGYNYIFLRNHSFRPSIFKGFWGLMNWGIIDYLRKAPKSVLVVHGWASFSHIMTIFCGKLFGHTVCLRAETPLNQELLKRPAVQTIKNVWLRFLFLFVDKYLYIGKQNKLFYESLGVKEPVLFFTPYCVDNKRFQQVQENTSKTHARNQLNLPTEKRIFLFSGKYIDKKRPMDLLEAFSKTDLQQCFLVMVGDGELREVMEAFIIEKGLSGNVLLTGFINQSVIPFYYAAADLFVMCSGLGETWGLSVNEAMNFKLPIIVSDTCGCSYDLVDANINGAIFETGNLQQLQEQLAHMSTISEERLQAMGQASLAKVNRYSYNAVIQTLKQVAQE